MLDIFSSSPTTKDLQLFCKKIMSEGAALYRDLPWRYIDNPYGVWVSEVMLQQTQVSRVLNRWERWLERFPTIDALASASVTDVLEEWQGLGYNRRALSLKSSAEKLSETNQGQLYTSYDALVSLKGIGPATAAGIRAFAFDLPGVYLETNVRTIFLRSFFSNEIKKGEKIHDKELIGLIEATCPKLGDEKIVASDSPREWYYALLDVGAYIKSKAGGKDFYNQASKSYSKQSTFEGSHRQKRSNILKLMLDYKEALSAEEILDELNEVEIKAKRPAVDKAYILLLLNELADEGFVEAMKNKWIIRSE